MKSPSEQGYEPGRLRRAAQLAVKRLGAQQFEIRGQDEPFYFVDLSADVPCYCKDAEYHGRGCKHFLAAQLANGNMPLIQALGDMLLKSDKANKALAKQSRKAS
jgi:hypothetical protein